jgi:hypothetical protein
MCACEVGGDLIHGPHVSVQEPRFDAYLGALYTA